MARDPGKEAKAMEIATRYDDQLPLPGCKAAVSTNASAQLT
jgi:hypothetical protein